MIAASEPATPPAELDALLRAFAATSSARACATPTGAYANCLAASVLCARWLSERGVDCGLLHMVGRLQPVGAAAGRWPFCDPAQLHHWTVRAGPWSVDWTARQFWRRARWPEVEHVEALPASWRLVEDWACDRCPELVADERHVLLAPSRLHREHRATARLTGGAGPFPDPRHDDSAPLVRRCACAQP